jgi:hypothetical protein
MPFLTLSFRKERVDRLAGPGEVLSGGGLLSVLVVFDLVCHHGL